MVLSDLLLQIYRTTLKSIEHRMAPLVVPAVLEHDPIPGISDSKPVARRVRSHHPSATVTDITDLLDRVRLACEHNSVDPRLSKQMLSQLFYHINATVCNHILLSKDLCHWSKGMQIRYNLTKLEEFAHNAGFEDIKYTLQESVELTKLLQVSKSKPEDVDVIFETCQHLNPLQIQKVLTMYSPGDYEPRVPPSLIRLLVKKGAQTADPAKVSDLLFFDFSFREKKNVERV